MRGLTKTNQSVGSDNQIDFIAYFLCIGDEMLEEVYDLKKVCKIKFEISPCDASIDRFDA